jgi:ATP-dependent DNA helicase DinG
MYEINYLDSDSFDCYKANQKLYRDGVYDFTFEERFIIYHNKIKDSIVYYAFDKTTNRSSRVTTEKNKIYTKDDYKAMVSKILKSIKYTGDTRHNSIYDFDPMKLIDTIFRTILPQNGYLIREEQIELSKNMYRGFTEKQVALSEAEVGTGKTLAYLVAAFAAKIHYEAKYNLVNPITISTATIELQKHLVEKEIPNLSKMLMDYNLIKRPFITVLRKGKEHYLCVRRLCEIEKDLKENNSDKDNLLATLEMLKKQPFGYDLDNYYINASIKKKICVKDGCRDCAIQGGCGYSNMVNSLYDFPFVDFQVTNHNLYLMSHKNKKRDKMSLRHSDFVVLDEAHKLKDVAQDVLGEQLSERDVEKFIRNVKTLCNTKTDKRDYKKWIEELSKENELLFSELRKIPVFENESNDDHVVLSFPKSVENRLKNMNDLVQKICTHKSKKRDNPLASGKTLVSTLKSLIDFNSNITWLTVDENNTVSICCCPKNIKNILKDKVWDIDGSFVLTSGTMSDGSDFDYFKSELGVDLINPRLITESSFDSPFDFKQNARVYMPKHIPLPDEGSKEYIEAISNEILKLIKATNGHTAILFTSYKVLSLVYEQISDQLTQYDVITMTRGNKQAITEFKKSRNGILFASGSMWEGVDCVGDCLSSVIIVKLPFPIRNAVTQEKKKNCKEITEFFDDFCTPYMLIKLRQGIGRLIRSETDTGVVSILDKRVHNDMYASKVEAVVEKYGRVESIEEIEKFISEVKSDEYKNS